MILYRSEMKIGNSDEPSNTSADAGNLFLLAISRDSLAKSSVRIAYGAHTASANVSSGMER